MKIKIKYHNKNIDKIAKIKKGDWIDLRAAETVELKEGDFKLIPLGVSMQLPDGYEAHILPRSSTFKNWGVVQVEYDDELGIMQTNKKGIVDNSYCGDNDIWKMPVLAMRDTVIKENDRICQFRIMKKQPEDIEFEDVDVEKVDYLGNEDRGGFGSTGIN